MSYVAHTETDEATGIKLVIESDSDLENPYGDDEGVKIVVLHGRYTNPCKDVKDMDAANAFEAANEGDDSEWYVVKLWLYDHSGTAYRVGGSNPFSCPWDSGRVGFVALKRSEWGGGKEDDSKLFKYAQGVAEGYSDYANGNGYAYTITDRDGELLASSPGFIGDYDAPGGALEEARAELKGYIAEALKEGAADAEAERPDLYA